MKSKNEKRNKSEIDYRIGQKVVCTLELQDIGQDFLEIDVLQNGVILGNSPIFSHGRLSLVGVGSLDGRKFKTDMEVILTRIGVLKLNEMFVYFYETSKGKSLPWEAQIFKYPVVGIKKPIKPNRFIVGRK